MTSAPDYVEPVLGWRVWLVVREGNRLRLRSALHDIVWPPRRELGAECLNKLDVLPERRRGHETPGVVCGCGIYATRAPERALAYLDGHVLGGSTVVHHAVGRVTLWGSVVECEDGWRGERAYPAEIFVPNRPSGGTLTGSALEAVSALREYGVRVELVGGAAPDELSAALRAQPGL